MRRPRSRDVGNSKGADRICKKRQLFVILCQNYPIESSTHSICTKFDFSSLTVAFGLAYTVLGPYVIKQLRQHYPTTSPWSSLSFLPFPLRCSNNRSSYNNWKHDGGKEYRNDGY
jgi:hypothetical protein